MANHKITNEQTGEVFFRDVPEAFPKWRYVVECLDPKYTYIIEKVYLQVSE